MSDETTTATPQREAAQHIACTDCEREITVCCFCDDPWCEVPMCDRCVRTALHEALKEPHVHGG